MEPLSLDSATHATDLPSALVSDLQAVYGRGQEQLRQLERLLSTRQPSLRARGFTPDPSHLPKEEEEEQQPGARDQSSNVGESDAWGFDERLMHTQRRADDRRRSIESCNGTGRSSVDKRTTGTRRSFEVSSYLIVSRGALGKHEHLAAVSPHTGPWLAQGPPQSIAQAGML